MIFFAYPSDENTTDSDDIAGEVDSLNDDVLNEMDDDTDSEEEDTSDTEGFGELSDEEEKPMPVNSSDPEEQDDDEADPLEEDAEEVDYDTFDDIDEL